jgi:UDP-N-acetyl-D-mannosaminuronic acid dehydrogenase
MIKKVCVSGLGYIGLPTAAIFAKAGIDVVGVDVNERVINELNAGKILIEEPNLPELVKEAVATKKLKASLTPEEADAFIIAVPTPIHKDQTANVDYVVSATEAIVPYVKKGSVIIVESTIPPRTMEDIVAPIFAKNGIDPKNDVFIAHCPERVLPGKILVELIENTRIVGGLTPEAAEKAAEVYRHVVKGDIVITAALTAEMSKLMENTFRDVNIALANELVKISTKLGVNAHDVIQLANMHPRVNLHQPGPGVGGHCLAVDPYFIVEKAHDESPLIRTARSINNSMPDFVIDQIEKLLEGKNQPKIAVLGLTYKGNVDDVRESPALEIVEKLKSIRQFNIDIHDPHVKDWQVDFPLANLVDALHDADIAVILADHNEFKGLDSKFFTENMKEALVLDTKQCYFANNEDLTLYHLGNLGLK